jgi:pyruvate dehydrogenase E1 component
VIAREGCPRAHYLFDRLTGLDAARHDDLFGRVTTAT